MIAVIAWVATIGILVSFALLGKYGNRQFDYANVVCAVPIGYVNFLAGTYPSVALNVAFGAVALWRILCSR